MLKPLGFHCLVLLPGSLTWLFSSLGLGPRLRSPRQLRCWNPQAIHATADHAGQPQGPHILFRKRARDKPFAAALQSFPQVAQRPAPRTRDAFLYLQITRFCNEQTGSGFQLPPLCNGTVFYSCFGISSSVQTNTRFCHRGRGPRRGQRALTHL